MNQDKQPIEDPSAMAPAIPDIRVGDYRLVFVPQTLPSTSRYLGSAWRGALGHALKQTACVTRQPVCEDCILYSNCIYTNRLSGTPLDVDRVLSDLQGFN